MRFKVWALFSGVRRCGRQSALYARTKETRLSSIWASFPADTQRLSPKIMSPMTDDSPTETEPEGFTLLPHGHRDMVGATAFNSYGERFASSSVDGKIKVYNRHRDGSWNLCDTWGAHTAEILQVYLNYTSQNFR